MTDSYNHEIGHRHQPTSIQNAIIRHKILIIEIITEIHHLKDTIVKVVQDEMTLNNITGEDIVHHFLHNVMEINNTIIKITRPKINLIIDRMIDKITIIEAVTEAEHHAGACSPATRHLVIKAVTEHVREHRKQ